MEIRFLGTSDGYPEKERYCSCTVVTVNGKHYVIDAGLALYSALLHNDLNPGDVNGVFITHMHGDHTNGLIEFVNITAWGSRIPLHAAIYVTTEEARDALLALTKAMDTYKHEVNLNVYKEGPVFEDENILVTAYRTGHGAFTYGFLLEAEGKKVYFTGDMTGSLMDLPDFVYTDDTKLIICESAHNCLPNHADKFNRMKTDRIIINHVAKPHSEAEFAQAKPLINKPFDLAFDGMMVTL